MRAASDLGFDHRARFLSIPVFFNTPPSEVAQPLLSLSLARLSGFFERGLADVDGIHVADYASVFIVDVHGQTGVNIGTGGPPSEGLKTRRTAWPIRIRSRSQSTMLVMTRGPSFKVT